MILSRIKACKYRENSTKKPARGLYSANKYPWGNMRELTYPLPLKMLILFPMWDMLVLWRVPWKLWSLDVNGRKRKKRPRKLEIWKRRSLLFWQKWVKFGGLVFIFERAAKTLTIALNLILFLFSLSESQKSPKLLLYNVSNMNDWNLKKATVGKRNTNLR